LLVAVAFSVQTRRTEIAKRQRAVKAVSSREWHPVDNPILEDNVTTKIEPTERTRAAVAFSVQTRRTEIAKRERANAPNRDKWSGMFAPRPLVDNVTTNGKPTERTRAAVAKEFGVPERKLISLLRGRVYERTKKAHGGAREASTQNGDLKTSELLAEKFGVSKNTIQRDAQFARAVDELRTVAMKQRFV